jgi:hypothetical protein
MIKLLILTYLVSALLTRRSNTLFCGIVGFSGFPGKVFDPTKITFMMYQNAIERGKDSTGIFTPSQGVLKSIEDAEKYFSQNKVKSDSLFIGHVRAATVGIKNIKNAHPFHVKNIIGVHNGTLKNHWMLCSERNIPYTDINVDSEAMFACIAHDQSPKVFTELAGAAAVLFVDTEKIERGNYELYAYRNAERPLYRGNSEEGMYISSLKTSLQMIGCSDIKEFKEGNFYTIVNGVIKTSNKYKSKLNQDLKAEEDAYKGLWLRYEGLPNYFIGGMTKGEFYKIDSVTTNHYHKGFEFGVKTKLGTDITVNKFHFDLSDLHPSSGEIGLAASNIVWNKTQEPICSKGAVLKVLNVNKKQFTCHYEVLESGIDFEASYVYLQRLGPGARNLLMIAKPKEESPFKDITTLEEDDFKMEEDSYESDNRSRVPTKYVHQDLVAETADELVEYTDEILSNLALSNQFDLVQLNKISSELDAMKSLIQVRMLGIIDSGKEIEKIK